MSCRQEVPFAACDHVAASETTLNVCPHISQESLNAVQNIINTHCRVSLLKVVVDRAKCEAREEKGEVNIT